MKKTLLKKRHIILLIALIILLIISFLLIKNIKTKKYVNLEKTKSNGELIDDNYVLEDSGITGEEYEIDEEYKIYYTNLSEDEKKLYKQIYANIVSFKETFIPVVEIDSEKILRVFQFVTYDNPELFWISNGFTYKYKKNNICKQITIKYNGLQYEYETNKKAFDNVVNEIVENAKNLETNYEKEKYVYNKIINSVSYDLSAYYNQTAYSALVNKKTVCAGYSKAFQYIMNLLGIKTYYVVGRAKEEEHAWNIIFLDDGYYNVDLTWEEFNVSDKEFASTHERDELSEILPVCAATKYETIKNNKKIDSKKSVSTNNNSNEKIQINNIENKDTSKIQINNETNNSNKTQTNISNNKDTSKQIKPDYNKKEKVKNETVEQKEESNKIVKEEISNPQINVENKKEDNVSSGKTEENNNSNDDIFGKVEEVGEDIIIIDDTYEE